MKALLIFFLYLTSMLGLQVITYHMIDAIDQDWPQQEPYRLWKMEQQEAWAQKGKTTALAQALDLIESILNPDKHLSSELFEKYLSAPVSDRPLVEQSINQLVQKNKLYSYNLLRERNNLPIAYSLDEIDETWLCQEFQRLENINRQERWKRLNFTTFSQKVSNLLFHTQTNLRLFRENPGITYYEQLALINFNFLREFLGRSSVSSLSQLDQRWLHEVDERLNPISFMELHQLHRATPAQKLLLDEAQRILGIKQKILAVTYPGAGEALERDHTTYLALPETPDLDTQLSILYHELGHIVHNDELQEKKVVFGKTTYDKLIEEKDFADDVNRIDHYTTIGKKAFTDETKVGRHINTILKLKGVPSLPVLEGTPYEKVLYYLGREKRADLHELDSLFSQKQISPLLQHLVEYGESDLEQLPFPFHDHPHPIERALYFAGYLIDKGLDINKLLKEWYAAGKCRLAGGLPPLDFVQSFFPGIESTQGARDVENAYELWLQQEKERL
jgi:hypothetical protein